LPQKARAGSKSLAEAVDSAPRPAAMRIFYL
jgi:hypothetical protein